MGYCDPSLSGTCPYVNPFPDAKVVEQETRCKTLDPKKLKPKYACIPSQCEKRCCPLKKPGCCTDPDLAECRACKVCKTKEEWCAACTNGKKEKWCGPNLHRRLQVEEAENLLTDGESDVDAKYEFMNNGSFGVWLDKIAADYPDVLEQAKIEGETVDVRELKGHGMANFVPPIEKTLEEVSKKVLKKLEGVSKWANNHGCGLDKK